MAEMSATRSMRKRTHEEYTVGWICPLEIEQIAAVEMLDEEHDRLPQPNSDVNSYMLGSIQGHNIVIAGLPTTGNCSTATVVAHMVSTFSKVRFGLLVGIGGGVPIQTESAEIRLGHVVVSQPSGEHSGAIQYDHGKAQVDAFERTGFLASPPNILLNAARRLAVVRARAREDPLQAHLARIDTSVRGLRRYKQPDSSTDVLYEAAYAHADRRLSCERCGCDWKKRLHRPDPGDWIVIHRGTVASGEVVMRNGEQRDALAKQYHILCFEMEAAGALNNLPCLVIRGISDYSDSHKNDLWHGYAAATAAAYARELFYHLPIDEVLQCKVIADVQDIKTNMEYLVDQSIFTQLPEAMNVAFDSYLCLSQDENADYRCMRGTRVGMLQKIKDWVLKANSKPIFWLSGVPGTGKSTIARTIAHDFAKQKSLAASFFFKRNSGDGSHALKLFSSIATQLAQSIPQTKPHIKKALELDSHIMEKDLEEQFEVLLLNPLRNCEELKRPFLFVIDALDECQGDLHTRIIIRTLSRLQRIPAARVFLTSRPELPIQMGFKQISDTDYQAVMLQDIPEQVTKKDLSIYLRHKLEAIRNDHRMPADWPEESIVKVLVDLADPLFIIAATICRFIVEPSWTPQEQIEYLLVNRNFNHNDVARIYLPILRRSLRGGRATELLESFRTIVGIIIVALEALSVNTLAALSELPVSHISARLDSMRSMLNIPRDQSTPLTLHHLSFANFLLDKSAQHEFRIDSRITHLLLARKCLEFLVNSPHLKEDVCGVKKLGAFRSEVDEATVTASIPPEVQYACCYWIFHLKACKANILDFAGLLKAFLTRRLLFWLEALSFLSKAHEAASMVSDLMDLLTHRTDLKDLVYDARRFIIANTYVLNLAPLQLYSSALIFSPENSIVRKNYNTPSWFKFSPTIPKEWTASLRSLEGHEQRLKCLAFSSPCKLLASGSHNEAKLWDIRSGKLHQTLTAAGIVKSIGFSFDGKLVALGTSHGHLDIWNLGNGEMHATLPKVGFQRGNDITSIAFSVDSNSIAFALSDRIQVWNFKSLTLKREFFGNATKVSFSSFKDGLFLSSSESMNDFPEHSRSEECIKLWHVDEDNPRWALLGHTATFSPVDAGLMLSVQKRRAIRLSDISSGHTHHIVSSQMTAEQLAFLPHGKQVIVCDSITFEVWNVVQNKLSLQATICTGDFFLFSVPCNGNLVACSSDSGTNIQIYELLQDREEQFIVGQIGFSHWAMAFSPDGQWTVNYTLASYGDGRSRLDIWNHDPQDKKPLLADVGAHTLCLLKFSSDSRLLLMVNDDYVASWSIVDGQISQLSKQPHSNRWEPQIDLLSKDCFAIVGFHKSSWVLELIDINTTQVKKRHVLPYKPDCIACSSDGKTYVYGVSNEKIDICSRGGRLRVIPPKGVLRVMSLSENRSVLHTNLGTFHLDQNDRQPVWQQPTNLDFQGDWLLSHGERILWMPPKYRGTPVCDDERFASGGWANRFVLLQISSLELVRKGLISGISELRFDLKENKEEGSAFRQQQRREK